MIAALLIAVAIQGSAQSAPESRAQETQARGLWADPSTGLTWAGKDNGKDVSWKGAVSYCRDLRLGGQTDWRLPTLDELKSIYDPSVNAPGLAGPGKGSPDTWHVKGNIFLTGHQWSANRRMDDRGKPSGYDWWFSFNDGKANNDPTGFFYPYKFMRALCVRGTQIVRPKEGSTLQPIP
jgi:hypothetical protein